MTVREVFDSLSANGKQSGLLRKLLDDYEQRSTR